MSRGKNSKSNPIFVLDRFSNEDLLRWKKKEEEILKYYWNYYSELAYQRAAISDEIAAALTTDESTVFKFGDWFRATDLKYSSHPLSTRGSTASDPGGRFNIGDIDRQKFCVFPCLYVADSFETAFREKMGCEQSGDVSGLSPEELALTKGSPAFVRVCGYLSRVFRLDNTEHLDSFVRIIRKVRIPNSLRKQAKRLGLSMPDTVKTREQLLDTLLMPDWRNLPMQVDIPSNSQLFGQMLHGIGIEGILYPSTKGVGLCLGVYPMNLLEGSFIELEDEPPPSCRLPRLCSSNWQDFVHR